MKEEKEEEKEKKEDIIVNELVASSNNFLYYFFDDFLITIYLLLDYYSKDDNICSHNYFFYKNKFTKDSDIKTLFVLVHGLRSSPFVWTKHIEIIKKLYPNSLVYVPVVKHFGNNTLEKTSVDILSTIKYANSQYHFSNIVFFGTSNGNRITHYVRYFLNQEFLKFGINVNMLIISIAGFFHGVPLIDWLKNGNWITDLFVQDLHYSVISDYKNENTLDPKWLVPKYTFYIAAYSDTRFIPISSSIPFELNPKNWYIDFTSGHSSIVYNTLKIQFKWIIKKLKKS